MRAQERRSGASATGPLGPNQAALLFAQAGAALQGGRLPEAEALFRQVLSLDPGHADAHNWLGVVLQQKGESGEALGHLRQAVALAPASADFANNLGIAELGAGNVDGARRALEKAVKLNPRLPAAHHNLGLVFQKRRELEPAIACFRRAIALAPDYVNAHLNLGNALQDSGHIDEAIVQYRKLVALAPKSREARFNLASVLNAAKRLAEAEREAREAVSLDPRGIEAGNLLVSVLSTLEHYDEAMAEARRVLALDPKCVEAHNRLGTILTTLGRFDEAISCFQASLAAQPDNAGALFGLANASKEYSSPEMADRIERSLGRDLSQEHRSMLHFALGKIYDDMGDYARAFENYRVANELAVPEAWFDAKIWTAYVDRVVATFTPDFFARRKAFGSPSRRSIFIFGMPRSGTTLTEQIVASHPLVAAGGELGTVADLVAGLPARLKSESRFPECATEITEETAGRLAADYLAALDKVDADAQRVTDKMPLNFQNLGLIALMFPQATFIHCRRDPLDTCLSCYFQKFGRGLDFSYSFENLGAYYRGYRRLMAHWREALPVAVLEVGYEDMVADQEGTSQRIIAHCGLEWDDRCLAFHKTERAVRTASVWQVRQPVYKTAVKRWQRYEPFLGPLRAALERPGR